jgi:4-hydroxy-tetrahydrodipicolinate reductase
VIRVAVAGALGRMGRIACAALNEAADVTYAGGLARVRVPQESIVDDLSELIEVGRPDVLLDVTRHPDTVRVSMEAIGRGVRPVIGATGWTAEERHRLDAAARERDLGAMLVPNFSIGAILMMRFAREAARYFPSAEIVELHHDGKKDAPSGTAKLTAEQIEAGSGRTSVPIHSVRMRGLVAHQEVLFGTDGELLTIRHDSFSRESFVPGILAAVRAVMSVHGLHVGLDA